MVFSWFLAIYRMIPWMIHQDPVNPRGLASVQMEARDSGAAWLPDLLSSAAHVFFHNHPYVDTRYVCIYIYRYHIIYIYIDRYHNETYDIRVNGLTKKGKSSPETIDFPMKIMGFFLYFFPQKQIKWLSYTKPSPKAGAGIFIATCFCDFLIL